MFQLSPALAAASEPVTDLGLCSVRLQRDARFPWLVLIPRIAGAVELEDLELRDRALLPGELTLAGEAVRAIGDALGRPVEKLNIGQLGNIAPQMHWHVIGRRRDDACWPGPVWGQGEPVAYAAADLATAVAAARSALAD
jgi:diadenosine tetraphosphate (Ap4A) HIT family hydrolase